MTEERDSQLSAMFDGELPGAECELLARRLTRDEALRAQWSRFSMIGAALRSERGVALHDRVAQRVQSAVAKEATYGDGTDTGATASQPIPATSVSTKTASSARWARLMRPVAGASIAAGVAALSIMWMRTDIGPDPMLASNSVEAPASESIVLTPEAASSTLAANTPAAARVPSNGEPDVYVTPAPRSSSGIAPPARLANYVVAHSEYSGPLSRRMALLGLVAADSDNVAPEQAASGQANDNGDAAAGAADAP
jgi:sigma-E factor negative regulatory protein RseA